MKRKQFFLILLVTIHFLTFGQTIQTLQLQPGPQDGIDCEIRTDMDWPINYEDDFISNAWTVQGNPFIQRSLLKFDLTAIPSGANIISAKLSLYCNTISGHHQLHAGNNSSYLLRILEPWNQNEVTWNTQPATTFDQSVILPQTTSQTEDYTDIDLTEMITFFHENPTQNYGFMLRLVEEIQLAAMVFSSSNHTQPEKRPMLTIEYSSCSFPPAFFKYVKLNNSNLVQFVVDSIDNADYWWDFGNDYYSKEGSPLFYYPEAGSYNVCLTVSNACGESTFCDSVDICVQEVFGNFSARVTEQYVEFTPHVLGDKIECFWDFGDGFYSDLQKPVHFYSTPGKYHVSLYASDFCNQLVYNDSIEIQELAPEFKPGNPLNVYPNPANGVINITYKNFPNGFQHLRVINFNGNQILDENHFRLRKNENGYSCDFTGMETGIYTIQIVTDVGIFTQKAVFVSN